MAELFSGIGFCFHVVRWRSHGSRRAIFGLPLRPAADAAGCFYIYHLLPESSPDFPPVPCEHIQSPCDGLPGQTNIYFWPPHEFPPRSRGIARWRASDTGMSVNTASRRMPSSSIFDEGLAPQTPSRTPNKISHPCASESLAYGGSMDRPRCSSTMRRMRSETVMPRRLASLMRNDICGLVKTIDRCMVFMWTSYTLRRSVVKGLA